MDTYEMIAVDLSKQQALDSDPRAIQQINFTANLDRVGNTRFYFILEEAKETILDFSQGTVKVLQKYYKIYCKIIFNLNTYKMTQYKSLNVKLSNSQLSKLKSTIKMKMMLF